MRLIRFDQTNGYVFPVVERPAGEAGQCLRDIILHKGAFELGKKRGFMSNKPLNNVKNITKNECICIGGFVFLAHPLIDTPSSSACVDSKKGRTLVSTVKTTDAATHKMRLWEEGSL